MGLATARMAREAGADVTIAARDPDRLAAAREALGDGTRAVALDVSDEDAVRDLFASMERVDHVVVTAGAQVFGRIAETDAAALGRSMDVRFWGALYVCKHAPPRMSGAGSITLCSGVASQRPRAGRALGTASTAALEAFARAMALELAPIRVNVVRPGAIDTPLAERVFGEKAQKALAAQAERVPLKRIGRPEEVADAVLFLIGNAYVTGIALTVDGGHMLV